MDTVRVVITLEAPSDHQALEAIESAVGTIETYGVRVTGVEVEEVIATSPPGVE